MTQNEWIQINRGKFKLNIVVIWYVSQNNIYIYIYYFNKIKLSFNFDSPIKNDMLQILIVGIGSLF